MRVCMCGCGERVDALHHICYRQHLRRIANDRNDGTKFLVLDGDQRNLRPVARVCHANHHSRVKPYTLTMLPDSVFEFAAELMGPKAFNYLRRYYTGSDPRLEALPYLKEAA